jgi:hypothetical protein
MVTEAEIRARMTSPTPANALLEKFKAGTQVKLPAWLSGLQRPGFSKTLSDYFVNTNADLYIGVQTDRGLVYVNADDLRLEVMHSSCPSCRCEKPKPRPARVRIARVELDDDEEPEDDEEED